MKKVYICFQNGIRYFAWILILVLVIEESHSQEQRVIEPELVSRGLNNVFYVYIGPETEDPLIHTVPSLWMQPGLINEKTVFDAEGSQSNLSIQFTVDTSLHPNWCGVAWSFAPNGDTGNWGDNPEIPSINLEGAEMMVIRAKGIEGNEILQFQIGIISNDDHFYGDSLSAPIKSKWFQLSTGWQDIEIEIPPEKDFSRIYTPVVWVTNGDMQSPNKKILSFLIGDIYYVFPSASVQNYELY